MFERFCALLLRLYPAEFRRTYGREAVQLMRDRARDERGVFLRARLLLDLAIDLFATSLRGWQAARPSLVRIDGAPRFDIIEVHGLRPEAWPQGYSRRSSCSRALRCCFRPRSPRRHRRSSVKGPGPKFQFQPAMQTSSTRGPS